MRYFTTKLSLLLSFALLPSLFADDFWDIQSDTWVATDGLGRTLPTAKETGLPKQDKTIGIFYFLWNGFQGDGGPFDVTKILHVDPSAMEDADHPLWGPMRSFHHWGEPIFDYYVATDDSVLRKHAQMLSDAGVDVVIFDVTNQRTFPEAYRALCRVFTEERKKGNKTPQIAFLTPFGRPVRAVLPLWNDFYSNGDYSDLWFRWEGKPLILADPNMIMPENQDFVFSERLLVPQEVKTGLSAGQSFTVDRPLKKVAIRTPTWFTNDASATLILHKEQPVGKKLLSKDFINVADNSWLTLEPVSPLPAGKYYLELEHKSGRIGWWSIEESNRIPGGEAFLNGKPCSGTRIVRVTRIPEDPTFDKIHDFFTFRNPQSSYTRGPTGPNHWSWLQAYPQFGFYSAEHAPVTPGGEPKKIEQMSVSVAQNIVDGRMGVISSPRAYGRSFHDGKQPPTEECDYTGKNFAEQWERVFELDPEFVFITSWNEWIMMRFPKDAPFHGASESEVNFVDQFNQEFSRDIEPMRGWHSDAFYYQMIANNRKFKGTRSVEPIRPKPIRINGTFNDWKDVQPEFRDTIGDQVQRNHRGWTKGSTYSNETGRNDLIAAKVSYDTDTLFFYVRTQDPIVGRGQPNWMLFYMDVDTNHETGWLGYDFMLDGSKLRKNIGKEYHWEDVATINGIVRRNEYEIAIPLKLLGLETLPESIYFKWADNIQQTGDWSDFTLNGDAAPNDRYNYHAVFSTPE